MPASRIREILADVHRRRLAGESLSDESILAAHPELGSELADQLRSLRRVEHAKSISDSSRDHNTRASEAPVDLAKHAIEGYQLQRLISRGGQGSIYRALQESTGRVVAIKTMFVDPLTTSIQHIRFEQEARFLAQVEHPHIVRVHHAGAGRGFLFLVMDFIDGVTLDDYTAAKSMTIREIVGFVLPICDAIHTAHMAGIIHRDLKPGNIVVDSDGKPLVIDFGLAKLHTEAWAADARSPATITGQVIGSLPWISPEQADGKSHIVDVRTDIYAIGLILYEMLSGQHAYDLAGSIREVLEEIATTEPPRPSRSRPEIGPELDAIVMTCLSKAPKDRYQSVHELEADLRRFLAGDAVSAKTDTLGRAITRNFKRHRRAVVAVVLPVAFAVIAAATAVWNEARSAELRRHQALTETLGEIQRLVDHNRDLREANSELEHELRSFLMQRTAQYFSPEKDRKMYACEDKLLRIERQREANYYRAMERLGRAERLGAEADDVKQLRAALFMEEYLDEINRVGYAQTSELRRQIEKNDSKGVFAAQLSPAGINPFSTVPAGAEVYLFHVRMQADVFEHGERRMVPVPTGDAPTSVRPGTWALRVGEDVGNIKAGDLILSIGGHTVRGAMLVAEGRGKVHRLDRLVSVNGIAIRSDYDLNYARRNASDAATDEMSEFEFERDDRVFTVRAISLEEAGVRVESPKTMAEAGEVTAEVFQSGTTRSIVLPRGLHVRITSQPLFTYPEAMIGITPLSVANLAAEEDYAFLLRAEGYEDLIYQFAVGRSLGNRELVPMNPVGTTPDGFRYVPGSEHQLTNYGSFWIKEHEVTVTEYAEFLNAPETLSRIAASASPMHYPRSQRNAESGGYCDRGENGRFILPSSWHLQRPVYGVSWDDAVAYAQWLTAKARRRGLPYRFSLPTYAQWIGACMGTGGQRRFVWGTRFRTKWASSSYSRPRAAIEPVMSFPIDESVYGVYDTAGSVSEWLDDWWLEDRGLRRHAGGSWADGGPEDMFGISGGNGLRPNETSVQVGFRVVLTMESADSNRDKKNRAGGAIRTFLVEN